MMYRLSIAAFAEDPRAISRFIEELKRVLSRECRCVDLAYANAVCECRASLVTIGLSMDSSLRRLAASPDIVRTALKVEIVIASSNASDVVDIASIVRDVAKSVGVGVRASA